MKAMNKPLAGILTACVLLAAAAPSRASMPIQKAAKEAGYPATTCLYCHAEKMPAKGKATYNDRGTYLVKTKEAKKAKEVDVAWLKDYVEPKK
jgi:cytochrome c553